MLPENKGYETDEILQIETNLDDLSPELAGHVTTLLFDSGALDVWITPIQMKKQRPGMLLGILCERVAAERMADILFLNTTAFGLRTSVVTRWKLRRDFIVVQTAFGPVTVKRGFRGDELIQVAPEFESCREAAAKHGCPVQIVFDAAKLAGKA